MNALLLLVSLTAAQPRCPKKGAPAVQPHPFRPLVCDTFPDVAITTATAFSIPLKPRKMSPAEALRSLTGAWEGWLAYGMERYEVVVVVNKDLSGHIEAQEHRTLRVWKLDGELRGQTLHVHFTGFPKPEGTGRLEAGAPQEAGWDKALLLSVEGKPSQQLLLKRDGKKLKLRYQDLARPGFGVSETELSSTKRRSLGG